jgi:antitoxin (DNA-binding transcriptional repressor) of toxin-antitoxin stability system
MTKTVDIEEASDRLRELVTLASAGHEVIIAEGELPVARLVAVPPMVLTRTPGLNRGEGWLAPDFSDPLPEELWNGPV